MKPLRRIACAAPASSLLCLLALAPAGCNNGSSGSATPSASASASASSSASGASPSASAAAPAAAPENLLLTLRGTMLRRALPLLFPEGGAAEVAEQLSGQITPGIGDNSRSIDIDSPFVVSGTVGGREGSTLSLFVAWPLKPGMQVAQDARALRNFRVVSPGLYAPTGAPPARPSASADAGVNPADHTCWVGQRQPVGWMLLCGPRDGIETMAPYLHAEANRTLDSAPVLDVDVRAGIAGRLARRQLAELDAHAPPTNSTDPRAQAQRAMFDDARRSAALFTAIANDVQSIHGSLTQDENSMHLRAELGVERATSDTTRALVAAAAGRQAERSLLEALPAAAQAYVLGGFDRAQMITAMGAPRLDPAMAAQAGPELARVMGTVDELKSLTPLGERVDAYSLEDGYTMYHVIRRPDAAQFIADLRVALNSVPARALPEGGTLRDVAASLPIPGLDPATALRIGRNVRIPPGAQVPPELRAIIERSMLLVAQGDRIIAVMGRDPVARYRAMSQGPRFNATVPPNSVLVGRISPNSFAPLFYGSTLPGLPESRSTDGVDFAVSVERAGEGARVRLTADAPIPVAIEVRNYYAMIQELQARMMQQMMEQARRAQQGGGGGGPGPGGGGGGGGGPRRPGPGFDPSQMPPLPEPPQLQLRPPQ